MQSQRVASYLHSLASPINCSCMCTTQTHTEKLNSNYKFYGNFFEMHIHCNWRRQKVEWARCVHNCHFIDIIFFYAFHLTRIHVLKEQICHEKYQSFITSALCYGHKPEKKRKVHFNRDKILPMRDFTKIKREEVSPIERLWVKKKENMRKVHQLYRQ